ncbi:MAG: hypothetical protein FWC27_00445 [Firmicutes bacterium]|nr:hypothetical protein [Bacillota bacterium]
MNSTASRLAAISSDFNDTDNPNFAPNPAGSEVTGNTVVGQHRANFEPSVPRFSVTEPNAHVGIWQGRKYWSLPGYGAIEAEQAGRTGEKLS